MQNTEYTRQVGVICKFQRFTDSKATDACRDVRCFLGGVNIAGQCGLRIHAVTA
jgi:hypothetical protein